MIEKLIVSKVRIKLLNIFLGNPFEMYHVRALVRKADEEINAVRRELLNLEEAGIVRKEPRGNRLYYWLKDDFPLYGELSCVFFKSSGLGQQILKNKNRIGKVSFCVFSKKFVQKTPRKADEVDMLLVGDIVMAEISALIKQEEEKRGGEINYTVMSEEEFVFRKKRKDPFLLGILWQSRVMLIGSEDELLN